MASEAAAVAAAVEAVGFHCGYFRAVQSSAGAASGPEDVHQFPILSRTVSRGHFLSLYGAGTEGSCAALQVRSTAADGELRTTYVLRGCGELRTRVGGE